MDGLTLLDIPGLVWDTQLGIAQKGLFPVGGRLSFFSPSLATDNLGQVCPGGYQTGVYPPFCEATPLSLSPVETPLLRLLFKRQVLWEEVSSLLNKGAVEMVDLSRDQGGFYSHYFLATKRTGWFCPILNLHGLNSFI